MGRERLIKLQYMRPYASCEVKKHQLMNQSLPKVKYLPKQVQIQRQTAQTTSIELPSTIRGIIGEAISFYSFTHNGSAKIKPKHLQNTVRSIFDMNVVVVKKQTPDNQTNNTMASTEKINQLTANNCVASMRHSYKRSKYFAFERLVKINSESYGAYNNWLKEKRKGSPVFVKITSVTKKVMDISDNNATLSSKDSASQIRIDEQNQQQINPEKTLDKMLKRDIKLQPKSKNRDRSQKLEQLFVTRTNLIRKIATNTQGKKISSIKYPTKKSKTYKFFLGPGNNHEIIKQVLQQTRGSHWSETTEYDTLFNLKWEQYSDKAIYQRLDFARYKQLINHFEFHQFISTKAGLIETLKQNSARTGHNMDIFQYVPITFVFDWADKAKFEDELKRFVYCYCQNHPDPERVQKMERDLVELSRYLWKGSKEPPNMSFDRNLIKRLNIPLLQQVFKQDCSQYLWIIKPSDLNRGRGIKIFSTLEELREIIKDSMSTDSFVVQKYIERPLLIKNRKFDIRVWVLVTPESEPFFFEEGYVRTSSEQFCLTDYSTQNQYIHLTNNAVQKNSNNYGIYEEGNQLSFNDMDGALDKQEGYFKKKFLPEIKRLCNVVIEAGIYKITGDEKTKHHINSHYIKETYRVRKQNQNQLSTTTQMITSEQKINLPSINSPFKSASQMKCPKKGSFEIFGFDFMIDKEEKVWLIQVNTNPCLQTSSKILQILIPRMIDDAFKLILDPIFKVNAKIDPHVYKVEGYEDTQNMWTILGKNSQI